MNYFDPSPEDIRIYKKALQSEEERVQDAMIDFVVFRWDSNGDIVIGGYDEEMARNCNIRLVDDSIPLEMQATGDSGGEAGSVPSAH